MRNPAQTSGVTCGVNRPRVRHCFALLLALSLLPLHLLATTVLAPDFDSLVSQADYVVRATVVSKVSEWRVDGANRHIITKVKLDIHERIKGTPPSPLVLEVLGGKIGDLEMVVEGAPSFVVGDDEILFIHGNGRQFIPIVAIMYGQYLVMKDATSGQAVVHRSNGATLYNVQDVNQPMTAAKAAASSGAAPVTATEFANRVRASLAQHAVNPPANAN